ncbi:MAG: hypothetical protein ACJAZO_002977 [Myxococcota bacterium]|jgi:hypothetical protein
MAIPGRYPVSFPDEIRNDDESGLERVRGDLFFGVDSTYYASAHSRVGAFAGLGLGTQFFDAHLQFEYNYVLSASSIDFLFGGGVGFGTHRFSGPGEEQLVVPYYPLRAESSALVRDNSRAYQLTVFGQLNVPSNHFYRDFNSVEDDSVGGGVYATLGIELAVFFGDFTPPRPRGPNGSGGVRR